MKLSTTYLKSFILIYLTGLNTELPFSGTPSSARGSAALKGQEDSTCKGETMVFSTSSVLGKRSKNITSMEMEEPF